MATEQEKHQRYRVRGVGLSLAASFPTRIEGLWGFVDLAVKTWHPFDQKKLVFNPIGFTKPLHVHDFICKQMPATRLDVI